MVRHYRSHRSRPDPFMLELNMRPMSDHTRIVFPWDVALKTFQKNEYSPVVYGSHISQAEVDNFLQRLSKCPNYEIKNYVWVICLLPLIMFGGFGAMVALIITGNRSRSTSFVFWPFFIMPVIFILLISAICCMHKKRMENLTGR